MSHWSGSRPLTSAIPLIVGSQGPPLGYPVVLCCGDAAVLDLWICALHMLQEFIDMMGVGVGRLKALVLGLVSNWV